VGEEAFAISLKLSLTLREGIIASLGFVLGEDEKDSVLVADPEPVSPLSVEGVAEFEMVMLTEDIYLSLSLALKEGDILWLTLRVGVTVLMRYVLEAVAAETELDSLSLPLAEGVADNEGITLTEEEPVKLPFALSLAESVADKEEVSVGEGDALSLKLKESVSDERKEGDLDMVPLVLAESVAV
jgi:hypothetical protein